jgi:SAM-dependent methyltransferase
LRQKQGDSIPTVSLEAEYFVAGILGKAILPAMDHSARSASAFDKVADKYQERFMGLTVYDDGYQEFCDLLPPGRARILDAACGPGNVSRFLMARRPELDLLGIDLAPRMVELARETVPSARFAVHDCRRLADLEMRFHGIICAFGLPYLSWGEARAFIETAGSVLEPKGVIYLSTILGNSADSGFERFSSGDEVHVTYHNEEQVSSWLEEYRFTLVKQERVPSPKVAPKPTMDLIVIARKIPC